MRKVKAYSMTNIVRLVLAASWYCGDLNQTTAKVGDDGFLRLWSLSRHTQIYCLDMGEMARCCAYSPDGTLLAVGFGGSVGRGKNKVDVKQWLISVLCRR
jgi:WD40 repeat protein